jgi:hypothetical protein
MLTTTRSILFSTTDDPAGGQTQSALLKYYTYDVTRDLQYFVLTTFSAVHDQTISAIMFTVTFDISSKSHPSSFSSCATICSIVSGKRVLEVVHSSGRAQVSLMLLHLWRVCVHHQNILAP